MVLKAGWGSAATAAKPRADTARTILVVSMFLDVRCRWPSVGGRNGFEEDTVVRIQVVRSKGACCALFVLTDAR